jgi:O-antigen/teichoic acid export membrane protein
MPSRPISRPAAKRGGSHDAPESRVRDSQDRLARPAVNRSRDTANRGGPVTHSVRPEHRNRPAPPSQRSAEEWRQRQLEGIQALLELPVSVSVMANPAVAVTAPLFIGTKQDRPRSLLKDRAIRGAVSLMLSAGATGGLSYVFWTLTAHHLGAAAIGKISAEVSSITFLAGVGSLNLTNIFGRFLPVAGWRARRLIATGYGSASLVGLLVALIFLASPLAKGLVIGGAAGSLAFVLCVVLNSVFVIQDGGLIGFGRFEWIPVENASVALLRFALLPVAAIFLSTQASVLGAWLLPMALAVVVVNIFNLGPLANGKMPQRPRLPSGGELRRLIAVGTISGSITATVMTFLPAFVTHRLGSAQGGYFYVPWMITGMASLLINNITTAMVREVVANPQKAGMAIRRSLAMAALVVIVVMTACLFLAGLILAPLGSSFATYGAPLMRWAGLAMPATAVIVFFWDLCSIRRRPWPPVVVNLFTAVAIFGGVLLLHPGSDIGRVGMIYCVAQWLAAIVVAFPTFTGLRAIARRKEPRRQRYGSPRGNGSYSGPRL